LNLEAYQWLFQSILFLSTIVSNSVIVGILQSVYHHKFSQSQYDFALSQVYWVVVGIVSHISPVVVSVIIFSTHKVPVNLSVIFVYVIGLVVVLVVVLV